MRRKGRVLVTGSDGYIGSVLVPLLLKDNYPLVGLDSLFFKNALLGKPSPRYKLIPKDIRQIKDADLEGFETIIHLAAISNDPLERVDPKITEKINYQATVDLARKAKRAKVKKFIFSSSCSVYGFSKKVANEKTKPRPLTIYAQAKLKAEKDLIKLADKNFCVALLRNSTVYGYSPKFRADLVVNALTACALITGEIKVKSDGTPWRALIDVRDLSQAFIKFLKAKPQKINGKIFNIGFNDNNFQVKDVINAVQEQLPACKVIYTGEHAGDTRSYRVNFNKFHRAFPGFKKTWPLKKSIGDLVKKLTKWGFSKRDFNSGKYIRIDALKKIKGFA